MISVEILTAIALWCGMASYGHQSEEEVQACRDKMISCVQKNTTTVTKCFIDERIKK